MSRPKEQRVIDELIESLDLQGEWSNTAEHMITHRDEHATAVLASYWNGYETARVHFQNLLYRQRARLQQEAQQ